MRVYFGRNADGGVSVSLSSGGKVLSVREGSGTDDLLTLLEAVLKSAKSEKKSILEIAVDRGPGGFSVVRRRVAVATALARSLSVQIAAVDEMTPEQAANLPESDFGVRAAVTPLYASEPNITISQKKKTWIVR